MEKNRSGVRSRRGKRDTEREGDKYTYVWIRVVGWGPQFCMKSRVPARNRRNRGRRGDHEWGELPRGMMVGVDPDV